MEKNQNVELNQDSKEKNKEQKGMTKSTKLTLIIGGVIIALLIVGGLCFELFFNKNPKDILTKSITEMFSRVEKVVDEYVPEEMNWNETDFSMSGDVSFDTSLDLGEYEDLKNYAINFKTNISLAKELMQLELGITDKSKEFLTAQLMIQDNKIYGTSKDLLSKVIELDKFDWEDNISFEEISINKEDLKTVVVGTKEMILSTIAENKITENKKVEALGKTNLTEIKYLLDEENQKRSLEKMLEYLKNNDKYLTAIANITEEDKEDILDDLEFEIEYYVYEKDYSINLYVEGTLNSFVGLVYEDEEGKITITENKVTLDSEDISFEIEKQKNDFKATIKSEEFTGIVTMKKETEEKMSANIEVNVDYEGETIKVNVNLVVEENVKVEKQDVKNAVKIKDLTPEEMQNAYTKFFEKIENTPFETIINEMFYGLV